MNTAKVERSKAYSYVFKSGSLLAQHHQTCSGNCQDQIFAVEEDVLLSKPVLDRGFDGIIRCKSKTSESFSLSVPTPMKSAGTSWG